MQEQERHDPDQPCSVPSVDVSSGIPKTTSLAFQNQAQPYYPSFQTPNNIVMQYIAMHNQMMAPSTNIPSSGSKTITRHKFSHEEDEMLKALVATFGTSNWKTISQHMHITNRSPRQCRERWKNYLSPSVQSGIWSEAEDIRLYQLHQQMGSQWSAMVKYFPGRTDINIKNHWATLSNRISKGKTAIDIAPKEEILKL